MLAAFTSVQRYKARQFNVKFNYIQLNDAKCMMKLNQIYPMLLISFSISVRSR